MTVIALDAATRPCAPSHASLRAVLAAIAARADAAQTDPHGLAWEIRLLAQAGFLAMGAGNAPLVFELLRGLGQANLSVGRLFEGHVNALKLVRLYGSPLVRGHIAQVVAQGGLLGVWGADGPRALRFTSLGDRLRLDGEKIFASGLGVVRVAIVTMREHGLANAPVQLAVVGADDLARQDPTTWTATGMRATVSGRYDFTGLEIPCAHCLGAQGDYMREPHFEGGIWRYCVVHLGGAEALVDAWRHALAARGRLDDPFQLARFARATGLCRAMASVLRATGHEVETTPQADPRATDAAVAVALLGRQFTEDCCTDILALAEKSLGMAAHVPGPIERLRRDLSVFLRQAAPDAKLLKAGRLLLAHAQAAPW